MNIDRKKYREAADRVLSRYRERPGPWQPKIEVEDHAPGEQISLEKYGQPGRFFSAKSGFAELRVNGRDRSFHVIAGRTKDGGWCVYIPALNAVCATRSLEIRVHNIRQLCQAMSKTDAMLITEGLYLYFKTHAETAGARE